MNRAKPDAIIMHPGPMNRGVEIATDVADGPYSVILDQVSAGVAVRMAILYLLLGVLMDLLVKNGRVDRSCAQARFRYGHPDSRTAKSDRSERPR